MKASTQSLTERRAFVSTISAGAGTFYAVEQDGTLYAWGERYPQSSSLETATPILQNVIFVDAGWRGCLAIDQQGILWSIGEYLIDQPDLQPVRVMENIQKVAVGLNHFICLTTDGKVYGCGRNSEYQLTSSVEADASGQYSPPIFIMDGVKDIATSDYDGCCAITNDGDLLYWGRFESYSTP